MREIGHVSREINDRYMDTLAEAHLAAAEQVARLVREAGARPRPHASRLRPSDCPPAVPARPLPSVQRWSRGWGSNPRPAD